MSPRTGVMGRGDNQGPLPDDLPDGPMTGPPAPDTTRNEAAERLRASWEAAYGNSEVIDRELLGQYYDDLDAALREQTRITVERVRGTLPEWFPCRCDDAYRKRGLMDPDCPTHDMERWLDEVADPGTPGAEGRGE